MEEKIKSLENKIEELTKINEEHREKFSKISKVFEDIYNNCNLLNEKIIAVADYTKTKNTKPSFVKNVADVFCLKGLFE